MSYTHRVFLQEFAMKSLCLLLCMLPIAAQADIYKAVDAEGHVTYSSTPIKGGKRLNLMPPEERSREKTRSTPQDFPKVNEETQKVRDDARKKILEGELKTEEGMLSNAIQGLKSVNPKDQEKLDSLNRQVELHQGNVDALKAEISRLK